jgi:hypothetical protein
MKVPSLFILFFIFSCTSKTSQKTIEEPIKINKVVLSDSSWTNKLAVALNLPIIDHGVDSFELRLWSSLTMTDLQTLTILRFSDGIWHCTESRYWIDAIDEWGRNQSLIADSVLTRKITPRSPIKTIIDSLDHYEIFKIPSQQEIPNFVDRTADGISYTLELAGPNRYYKVSYRNLIAQAS